MEGILKSNASHRYSMLGRFKRDCEKYLNHGNRNSNVLWALDEKEHIENIKNLFNTFDEFEKPVWLTWDRILEYEGQMLNIEDPTNETNGNIDQLIN